MRFWNDLAGWLYGDPDSREGFWYSHVIRSISGLEHEQLYRVPDSRSLCLLWHAGHIAHRETTHIQHIILGRDPGFVPVRFEVFGPEWCAVEEVRNSIDSPEEVFDWIRSVRRESRSFIESLTDQDLRKPAAAEEEGLTVAHWLMITAAHCALHIGKMQLIRNMLEARPDNPC